MWILRILIFDTTTIEINLVSKNPTRFSRLRNLFTRGLLKIAAFYGALLKACNSIVKSNNLRWFTHQPPPSFPPHSFLKLARTFLKSNYSYIFSFIPPLFSFLLLLLLLLALQKNNHFNHTRVTVYLINTRRIPRDPAWLRWII